MLASEEEKDTYIIISSHTKKIWKSGKEIVIYDQNLVIYF